ncbi:MAG: class I SAM-dependent methyltransferase [Simkaniaceae bacterium]|nr:class I SAM-dependent methyltransferase [Simkaniaceae bacterium]
MKKMILFLALCTTAFAEHPLDRYKAYLENGTYENQDFSHLARKPLSRYDTFKAAFEGFKKNHGKIIVELGTSRSFTHGGHPGCNLDDRRFWTPSQPENWDWGAGFFTRMCAETFKDHPIEFHTVDLIRSHIARCQWMTKDFPFIRYHVNSSLIFLKNWNPGKKIDLLYLDTGDMTPIEPTAQLQLAEAKLIVSRNLIAPGGLILVDDVRNQTPRKFGETSDLGKSKYALPYLLKNGFELVMDEYQVLLRKI